MTKPVSSPAPEMTPEQLAAAVAEFDLNRHTARLLTDEPFFAALSRRINKKASGAIPTAGVRVTDDGHFEMLYNPAFFAKLDDVQRAGVLKHEFYHLVFEHVTGRLPDAGMSKMWNIATDLAINSHLVGELPEMCCMPGEGPFADMEKGKSAEHYFAALKKKQEEQEEQEGDGEGGGSGEPSDQMGDSFDDHSGWGEGQGAAQDIAKERLKESVKKAAEEAQKANSWGSVSSQCKRDILDRIASKVDWRKVLRYFIKTSQRSNKTRTVKRLNKRYPYIHAGSKVRRQARIAISIDQSGSVDDSMLAAFFSELNKLAELAEFTVIPFDTEVAEEYIHVWKRNEKRKWVRVRYGGTDFNPPTKYVNDHGFDGHIVLTDLMAPKPISSKCQRMWMTTKRYAERPYFQTNERIIAIDCD
jgi:predicted metal-dependent peptidase